MEPGMGIYFEMPKKDTCGYFKGNHPERMPLRVAGMTAVSRESRERKPIKALSTYGFSILFVIPLAPYEPSA
jgi:hypothetical protein